MVTGILDRTSRTQCQQKKRTAYWKATKTNRLLFSTPFLKENEWTHAKENYTCDAHHIALLIHRVNINIIFF